MLKTGCETLQEDDFNLRLKMLLTEKRVIIESCHIIWVRKTQDAGRRGLNTIMQLSTKIKSQEPGCINSTANG